MTWLRLDDSFYEHEKFGRLEKLLGPTALAKAGWLWVVANAYSARVLNDGHLCKQRVFAISPFGRKVTGKMMSALVEVGLWDDRGDDIEVHDFLEYNLSAERVKAERQAGAARAAEWRDKQRIKKEVKTEDTLTSEPIPIFPVEVEEKQALSNDVTPYVQAPRSRSPYNPPLLLLNSDVKLAPAESTAPPPADAAATDEFTAPPSARSLEARFPEPPGPLELDIGGDVRDMRPAEFETYAMSKLGMPMLNGRHIVLRSQLAPFSRAEIDRAHAKATQQGGKVTQAVVLRKIEFERHEKPAEPMPRSALRVAGRQELSYQGRILQRGMALAMAAAGH